MKKLEDNRIHS